jgi:hypothetical protein
MMNDILYSKLRLEVPSCCDGEDVTIMSSDGTARTIEMTNPFTDIMLAGMRNYRVQTVNTDEQVLLGYGQIKKITVMPQSLDDVSWAWIRELIREGIFENYYDVGDTKSIIVNGNTMHLQVASINDGYCKAFEYYPDKTVDFISVEAISDTKTINMSDTNVNGWHDCSLRTYLNNTFFSILPNDLKNVIIEKAHFHTNGNKTTTFGRSSDKLWLPTEWEMSGVSTSGGETETYNKWYSIFSSNDSRKKTRIGESSSDSWWLSSPSVGDSTSFCCVSSDGSISTGIASSELGVPICFRIG